MGNFDAHDAAALYDRHAPELYRYLYHRLGSRPAAEDLTAEVFVRALGVRRAPDNWRAFLYRIAHNLAVDYVRRNPRLFEPPSEEMAAERGDPVMSAERQEASRELRRAIARLTPEQQQVIVLRFVEEMSNAEIAEILNKPEGAVKALQHRALVNLRAWLGSTREPQWIARWNESV